MAEPFLENMVQLGLVTVYLESQNIVNAFKKPENYGHFSATTLLLEWKRVSSPVMTEKAPFLAFCCVTKAPLGHAPQNHLICYVARTESRSGSKFEPKPKQF